MNSTLACMLLTSVITLTPPGDAPVVEPVVNEQIEIVTDEVNEQIETVTDEVNEQIETTTDEANETPIETLEVVEELDSEEPNAALPAVYRLDVQYVPQYPELPTGCEATALTTVLNFLGYGVDKCTIADVYMPKGKKYVTDPEIAFMGDPHDEIQGWGCFAPAIVTTANNYLCTVNSTDIVLDLTGTDLDTLCRGIYDYGRPAIVWGSNEMKPITAGRVWYANGKKITWRTNNHCLVLMGWDEENYILADPLKGIVSYNKDLFRQRYEENQRNAVFIFDSQAVSTQTDNQ